VHDDLPPEDGDDPLDPLDPLDAREVARLRRRDHDLEASHRDLMRPGMGKVFKQITDAWGREVPRGHKRARKTTRDDS
jgi:hypothetical protein